jgi:hypothetical protein
VSARLTFDRRRLLLGALGMGVSLVLGPIASRLFSRSSRDELGRRLVRLLERRDSARVVGAQYLRIVPAEASPRVLEPLIAERLEAFGPTALSIAGDQELRRRLGAAVLGDFEEGRTVELDGWVLSLTEARLCALATCRPS